MDDVNRIDRLLLALSASRSPDPERRGTIASIDSETLIRGVSSVREGRSVSLARPLVSEIGNERGVAVEPWVEHFGPVSVGYDKIAAACHGLDKTHLDGLAHVGWEGTWYGGVPVEEMPKPTSIEAWAKSGIVGRGLYVDVPRHRQTSVVQRDSPVDASEIDSILSLGGVNPEPGDALLLDLGRDQLSSDQTLYPAVSDDVAEWIADNRISMVLWDLLDAPVEPRRRLNVHRLIWAIGLALVDNCDFRAAREAGAGDRFIEGLVVVAPLPLPNATGSLVNPILIF